MISHFHRTIFVHIPKCGGQSIESAFLADLGLNWQLRAPLLLRPNDEPKLGPARLAHLVARDYVRYHYLSEELFQSYYSFAVLRDPVARAISIFNSAKLPDELRRALDFDAFLYRFLPAQLAYRTANAEAQNDLGKSLFYFVRDQADFVTDDAGRILVKDLFTLETIERDFPLIRERSMLRSALGHRNKSDVYFRRSELTSKQEEAIRALYARDVALLESLNQR